MSLKAIASASGMSCIAALQKDRPLSPALLGVQKPVTEKLTITADPRSDGLVKSKTSDETTTAVYDSWYESVHEPTAVTEGS